MKYKLVPGMCEDCAFFGEKSKGFILCAINPPRKCQLGITCYKEVQQTNGDKIRAMSNEELAELLYEASDTVGCPGRPGHWKEWKCPVEGTNKPCDGYICWLNWLNAEAKKGE